jgi:uncharacterized protein with HEPN domain
MLQPTWRDPKYLLDMLLAARDAEHVVADLSQAQFEQNRTAQLAAAHALQIIGEAASRVSQATEELHPEIPCVRWLACATALCMTMAASIRTSSGTRYSDTYRS